MFGKTNHKLNYDVKKNSLFIFDYFSPVTYHYLYVGIIADNESLPFWGR